jgi:hypothetical protein
MDVGRCAPRVRLAGHLLAALSRMVSGWHLGADVAHALQPARCPREARVGTSLPGREFRARQKGGSGVGNTHIGTGSNVMVVADGHGWPSGLSVASAQPPESQLADAPLATIRVLPPRGRPRPRPKDLVADNADDRREWRQRLRRRGIKPTMPTVERRQRRQPTRGRPIKPGPRDRQRWKVERCFGWMANDRRLVVRYERAVEHDKAFCLMAIILWSVNVILK